MFGDRPFCSWPSRFPLCLCDDRTGLILYDDGSVQNPRTEGGRLIYGHESLPLEDGESISYRRCPRYPDSQQLFVGNLPQNVSEKELRTFFEDFGNVVELRINTKGGFGSKIPNFGFVVFDSPEPVQTILQSKPIKFHEHRLNVEEKKTRGSKGRPMERSRNDGDIVWGFGGRGGSAGRGRGPKCVGPSEVRSGGRGRGFGRGRGTSDPRR